MKFIHRIQCLPNKHIYFINGSFTSFLIHLFLELGIDLFRGKNSSFTTVFRGAIPDTHWCKHRQNFDPASWLKSCFPSPPWDKGQLVMLPNKLPTRRRQGGPAELNIYCSQFKSGIRTAPSGNIRYTFQVPILATGKEDYIRQLHLNTVKNCTRIRPHYYSWEQQNPKKPFTNHCGSLSGL